uniref:Large ribosomal subunit protein eL28 n=1 Tax=Henneguya salminicola TaxID=69463 RepID=A0A6G3MLD1_HENSL
MFPDLEWELIKKNSCFLIKNNRLVLSKEPFNLMGLHCKKNCGLIQNKAVDVRQSKVGKEIIDIIVKKNGGRNIAKMFDNYQVQNKSKSARITVKKTGHIVKNVGLHPRFTKDALKRSSNLLRDHTKKKSVYKKTQKHETAEYIVS